MENTGNTQQKISKNTKCGMVEKFAVWIILGRVAEWSKALDSKSSVRPRRTVGSNPTSSAL